MSIQVKLRRGTTTQHSTFTGSEGEVTVDTTKDVVVVHDGVTAGGHPMAKASALATVATTGDYNDLINKPTAGTGTVTSVALSAPVGFSVSGSPVTTSGTLALAFDTGYSLPTTTKQGQWDTAYSWGNHASAGYLTTETDPVFSAHPAHNVTSTNLTEWAAAYNDKINSASFNTTDGVLTLSQQDGGSVTVDLDGRYLQSYSETDPIYTASSWYTTTNNSSNWNTAYSWGNHASAGYLTSSAIGTTVQAYDADLTAWAGVSTTAKQDTLVSGTNIKTVNGTSLLGSGDLTVASSLTVKDEGTTLTTNVTSFDFVGAGVTASNSGGAVTVTISGGGSGGGISSADIQDFTSTGTSTWTKPAGAKMVHVLLFGGGGGGGGGRRRGATLTSAAYGGGGGGSGGRAEFWIPASLLGSTETVTVGAGGTGGAGSTVDDTNGSSGSSGQDSTFGSFARARSGSQGAGGTASAGVGGTAGGALTEAITNATSYNPGGGSGSNSSGTAGFRGGYRPGGAGGGAGFTASSTTVWSGGTGGLGGAFLNSSTSNSSGGGSAGNSTTNAGDGPDATNYFVGGSGGGGGGSSTTGPSNGGNGGYPGGGGGGGGAGQQVNSGAGGNGGNGFVRVTTYF